MDGDEALSGELAQSRAYGVEARSATRGDTVREGEVMLGTKLLPEVLLLGREHEDQLLDLGGELP